eukprot:CAMPEP_0176192016 /NCGR_PEP_ID=MMETSP0121_2-20121125/4758_1 /TAXON_ID=160619 /ORGANISM="Kryptoperidinium foliaceum, Strain CCMP 1326" /LENGTH=189 /DNA_ID=CAMNT_0017530699 /DNA_START=167 /DNA_END=736 /DNA_ORIENTATION=+
MPPLQNEPTWHSQVVLPVNLDATQTTHDLQGEDRSLPKALGKKPRSVRFSTQVDIRPVICRQDMSPDEVTKVWMDRFDRRENKRDINNTIFLMRSGLTSKLNEDDFFCPRGLEHFANHENEQKVVCKKSVAIALAMQRVLRKAGTSNPVMIARAYRKYTMKSKQVAYKKALYDQAFTSLTRDPQGNTKR